MGDNPGFDFCECVNNHESAMQRLLGMLRQSQAYCSDSSCIDDLSPTPQGAQNPLSSTYLMIFVAFMAIFGAIFFGLPFRQNSDGKPRNNFRGNNPEPPAIS